MKEQRGYQYDFSATAPSVHDTEGRIRKAKTMVAVLDDYFEVPLQDLHVLDVGASTGIIDNYLADHFKIVHGIDIDTEAIRFANETFRKDNLTFCRGDALETKFPEDSFDIVICSQVYEHVPDAYAMISEIFRVLRPGGVCYFAAGNRLRWNEPHYNLPLLSAIPRPLAHVYIRATGKASHYHELHYSYWGLKRLVKPFEIFDYTVKMINSPDRFGVEYMIPPGTRNQTMALTVAKHAYWLVPGYIWLLRKPGVFVTRQKTAPESTAS